MHRKPIAIAVLAGVLLTLGWTLWPSESRDLCDDRAAAGPPSAADHEPTLSIYPANGIDVPSLAARLEKEFGGDPSVRIVPDARRSQVLVLAPPDVHAQIAARLNAGAPSRAPGASGGAVSRHATKVQPSAPTASQEVRLGRTPVEQFEALLLSTLGNRMVPVDRGVEGVSAYRLSLADGQSLVIAVNRRTPSVEVEGPAGAVASAVRLIQTLDNPALPAERNLRLVSLKAARAADVQPAVDALALQQPPVTPGAGTGADRPGPAAAPTAPPAGGQGAEASQDSSLIGPVQVEMLEGLDVVILRGHPRDVEKVAGVIEQIEQLSEETRPAVEVIRLWHVDCSALATLLSQVYEEVFLTRQGGASILPLVKPNALLVIGRPENVATVVDLVKRLDQPVPPSAQFQVFRLRHAAAETAMETVDAFLAQAAEDGDAGLGTRGQVFADFRTNSLVVRACPRDLREVGALVARLDAPANEAVNEVRVFKLKNSLATELAPVLQDAITGQMYGQQSQRGPGASVASMAAGRREDFERKSVRLRFVTIDPDGRGILNSGILTDAQVTADARTNSLLVTASAESMPLIAALIEELDQLPSVEAQIKVFTLVNSDATSMATMLQSVFGTQPAGDAPAVRAGTLEGESTLVGLRFAVDARTNSIIASGSAGQLTVVEAILVRLDESDVRNRQSIVYRLKNAPALDVAAALNEYLRSERQVEQVAPGLLSAFEQIEREVVVVPEPVSNSLIVSATPRFFEEITALVKQLDERPPMVMIQVLIAEVTLNDTDEFGVELGLQDSILFDRSVAGTGSLAGTMVPGYLFNSTGPLGNSAQALEHSSRIGSQGISNLGVGRLNTELGFGGLVLSASSEAVSVLIRALRECRRVEVLSRPQIMTMDNQTAEILVGQDVPTITASQFTDLGAQINSIDYREVGLILTVTPRISPDKLVVMEIDATNSDVGPEAEGIPVSVAQGQVIRSPRINITSARTVVSATNGQTVVLGGLITKSQTRVVRKVPHLGDLPVLKHLFRYEGLKERKAELLIIMTPHIVYSEEDAERIKRIESARMDWCLADVLEMHDGYGLTSQEAVGFDAEGGVIYPDLTPTLDNVPVPGAAAPMPAPTPMPTPAPMPPAGPQPPAGPTPAPAMPAPMPLEEPGAGPIKDTTRWRIQSS